jgi:hypothetical protein
MDTPKVYEIRVDGHLGSGWSEWFEGTTIRQEETGHKPSSMAQSRTRPPCTVC